MRSVVAFIGMVVVSSVFGEDLRHCRLGWNATENGDHKVAVELFEKCIEEGRLSKNLLARTYRNMGIALRRDGEYEHAVTEFKKAISLNPRDPWNDYVNLGNAWSGLEKYDKAMASYETALELKPNYGEAYYNRGIVYEKRGEHDNAKKEFVKAYKAGLRTRRLYGRLVTYGLIKSD